MFVTNNLTTYTANKRCIPQILFINWDIQSKNTVHPSTRLPALSHGAESHEVCSGHLLSTLGPFLAFLVMTSDFHQGPHVILGKRLLTSPQGGTYNKVKPIGDSSPAATTSMTGPWGAPRVLCWDCWDKQVSSVSASSAYSLINQYFIE